MQKKYLTRNICLLFVILFFFHLYAVAQEAPKTNVLTARTTLKEVIKQIETATDYTFVFNSSIDLSQQVARPAQGGSVAEILNRVLSGRGIRYEIFGKQIILKPVTQQAQTPLRKVEGIVSDAKGEPITGVSILVKGTSTGTVTNIDGYYSLSVPENGKTLRLSFLGYKTTEAPIGTQSRINVTLEESDQSLDEVVVVGYGTQLRSLLTGAVSTFKPNENTRRALNPGEMLDGTVAGVSISKTSGNLGTGFSFNIRGAGSINAGNDPLIVIDGIPLIQASANVNEFGEDMTSLSILNTSDIESIEILKDAASASIYGSRATNGVVIITTKSGKSGKPKFDLNIHYGLSTFPNRDNFKMADSKLFIQVVNEGIDNQDKQNGLPPGASAYRYLSNPFGNMPDFDWLGGVLQTAEAYNIDASFSGGDRQTAYFIGGSYAAQDGLIRTNHVNKLTLKSNVKHQLFPWLQIGANSSAIYIKNNRIPGSGLGTNTIGRTVTQRPFDKPYKPNGDYYVGGTADLSYHNMIQILNEETSYLNNLRYLGVFHADMDLYKGLKLKNSISTDVLYTDDYINYNESHPYGKNIGLINEDVRLQRSYLLDNYLNYENSWRGVKYLLMVGHSFQHVGYKRTNVDAQGFPSPSFDVTGVAAEITGAGSSVTDYYMDSYFGRANFSYEDKYLMTLTFRSDGSSKFYKDNRYGYFPSASAGWNVSKESFWAFPSTDLKLRLSYGLTGNQEGIGTYAWQPLITGGADYNKSSGIAISTSGNKDLKWEKANQLDLGFDLALLNGKINMMADFYRKNTSDLLYNKRVPTTSGETSRLSNIGSMRNTGVEFTINTNFMLGNVKWSSSFNIAHNKNKLLSLTDDSAPVIYSIRAYKTGEEVGIWYLPVALGIYQSDDEVPAKLYNTGVRAGDVKYLDVNGNETIDTDDYQVCGSSNPKVFGGWSNTVSYRGFDLNVLLAYKYGHKVYSAATYQSTRIGEAYGLLEEAALGRWTGAGTSNFYPRAMPSSANNYKHSSRYLQDGSFLRLRSLTLSYNVPGAVSSKLGMKQLRIYLQGDNLWLLTAKDYIGYDPESTNRTEPAYEGYDNYIVPQPRAFSFGLNLTF